VKTLPRWYALPRGAAQELAVEPKGNSTQDQDYLRNLLA